MADNHFKIQQNNKRSIFSRIEDQLNASSLFDNGIPVKFIPHVLFLTFLGLVYIGNSHYGEVTQRKMNRLEVKVGNLRADYTTLKADYMYARLQSEVARKVSEQGLVESIIPPERIEIAKGEY